VTYAQGEGYIQVSAAGVLVLVEEAHAPGDLDVADLREKQRKAQDDLAGAEPGSEEARRAARAKRRWDAFLEIAEGGGASSS
jgi:F-type H+-transporting ATPase subunit epsilon